MAEKRRSKKSYEKSYGKKGRKAILKRAKLDKSGLSGLKRELAESLKLIKIIERGKYQWQATFDAISDPVAIVSSDFRIIRANLGLANVVGEDIRGLIGKKCYKAFAGRREKCDGCPLLDALGENKPRSERLTDLVQRRDYIANAFPYADSIDGKKYSVVHYQDITEEKRLQQELIQQEKMAAIGMLAGGVAHEINNPLGGIIAFAQLIKRDLAEGDLLRGDIEEIERAAMRCKKIVKDLLDFSRISSGTEKHWIEINPLLEKVIPFIKMELKSLNIDLDTSFEHDPPRIWADANRLEQVFLNLLTNACQSMRRGGVLSLKTYVNKSRTFLCVEIRDTGCGIPKEALLKVFDPFFTTKMPGEGTGLGLSISYKIIRELGGRIDVKSELGKGSVFIVRLPIIREGKT